MSSDNTTERDAAAAADPAKRGGVESSPFAPGQVHPSAMRSRFSSLVERIAEGLFGDVVMNEAVVDKIRGLSERGTVVYVLRHRSFIDYFLVNYVLRREGLPLPEFANDISSIYLAPAREILSRMRVGLVSLLRLRGTSDVTPEHEVCAETLAAGRAVLVFMRGRRVRSIRRRFGRTARSNVGSDYLREIVHHRAGSDQNTFIVPIALFRGHSFRRRETTGISALVYTVHEFPSDRRKLITYWWNRKDLFVTAGTEVDLTEFSRRYQTDGEERLVRRLTRAVQIFLHREERIVLGPALMPRKRIRALVLESEESRIEIKRIAEERGVPEAKVRKEAEGYFEEMAADFSGIVFGVVAWVFNKLWNRMFTGLEPVGLAKVVEKAKHHPIVLVPCHRSHFDYLILSYLFYLNFVSPPHIAAGINMRFWPMGRVLRGSGAYFIRRTFGDNELYKLVFRQYLTFLIREGYTQEFFIEGGRSRTGKILTPKLGMLSAIVEAYLSGIRRDLYLVPVSIHYGRIVEEDAYQDELSGGEKEPESFAALVRARRFLQQKYGKIYVSFADPISLNESLGERKRSFVENPDDPKIAEQRRRFVQRLGFRILKDVNEASVAGATSISAAVLLGASHWGLRYEVFRERANALAGLVRSQNIVPTSSLKRNIGDFKESVAFLSSNGLIQVMERGREEVLVVEQDKRLALDFYKNNLIHAFLVPSLISSSLAERSTLEGLTERVWWWLDLFRWEFPLPVGSELAAEVDEHVAYFREQGAIEGDELVRDHPLALATAGVLESFRETYYLASRGVLDCLGEEGASEKALAADILKSFRTAILLGEVSKPEGASLVTFKNALSRLAELGFVRTEARGRGGREKWILRGDSYGELPDFVDMMAASLAPLEFSPRPVGKG